LLPIILILFLVVGCATTQTRWGEWQNYGHWYPAGNACTKVSVKSYPDGATVYVNGVFKGRTPLDINLSYPILKSEDTKIQYEISPRGLFSGPSQRKIGEQKQEKTKIESKSYRVEFREEGFISAVRTVTVPETKEVEVILKTKPILQVNNFSIRNSSTRSAAQQAFDAVLFKAFKVETAQDVIHRNHLNAKMISEVFVITSDCKNADYVLNGEVVVQNRDTTLWMYLVTRKGVPVVSKNIVISSSDVNRLYEHMNSLTKVVLENFLSSEETLLKERR
ncbi:MAG: PEGA domain-containing protein, partial [archaeon]